MTNEEIHIKHLEKLGEMADNFGDDECMVVAAVIAKNHPDIMLNAISQEHKRVKEQLYLVEQIIK